MKLLMKFILILFIFSLFLFIITFPKFFGIILLIIISLCALYQILLQKLNKEKNSAINIVTKKITPTKTSAGDSIGIVAGAVSISLYDIYASTRDHSSVLETIEERFPHAVKDFNAFEWYEKISDFYSRGTIDTYISAYAGEKAEQITIDSFESQGIEAEQFISKTHQNDDIRVLNDDGTYTDYSIKSMSSILNFNQEVQTHPDSTHYVVNKELYDELEERGMLRDYTDQGINVMRGNYSNLELREEASRAFEQIVKKGDIAENIPLVAGALLIGKSYNNIIAFRRGVQSAGEFRVNILSDSFKVGTSGTSAFVGAKIGMIIGSAGGPISAIVVGGVGAIVAAFTGTRTINLITDYFKWSDVYKAQSHFATLNKHKLIKAYSDALANKVFNRNELLDELKEEEQLLKKYDQELDFIAEKPITLAAILCELHIKQLNKRLNKIDEAITLTRKDLLKLADELAETQTTNLVDKVKVKEKIYGEVFLTSDKFFSISLDENSNELERKYQLNKKKNPNYPTRLPQDSNEIVLGLAIRNFNSIFDDDFFAYKINIKTWIIIGTLLFVSLALIFPIIMESFKLIMGLAIILVPAYITFKKGMWKF